MVDRNESLQVLILAAKLVTLTLFTSEITRRQANYVSEEVILWPGDVIYFRSISFFIFLSGRWIEKEEWKVRKNWCCWWWFLWVLCYLLSSNMSFYSVRPIEKKSGRWERLMLLVVIFVGYCYLFILLLIPLF